MSGWNRRSVDGGAGSARSSARGDGRSAHEPVSRTAPPISAGNKAARGADTVSPALYAGRNVAREIVQRVVASR
jgi:hypothetical protein